MFYIKSKTELFVQNHQPPKASRNVNSTQQKHKQTSSSETQVMLGH